MQNSKLIKAKKSHKSSFADKSTNSIGKTETEAYQDAHIAPILQVLNVDHSFKCAILVGNPKGLNRHLNRMRQLGYSQKDVVIFEWCPKLALKLKKAVAKRGLKCQVIQGDLIGGVNEMALNGVKFNYIEFDSVQGFGVQEPRLYALVKKWNIPVLITQGSGRGQADWFKRQAKKLGSKKYLNHGYECFKLEDSADTIIKKNLKGYDSHLITYGGRETLTSYGLRHAAPMYMAISIGNI